MNCLFCEKRIQKISLKSLFVEEDMLCEECRSQLKPNKRYINDDVKITYFFDYNTIFKSILIQYKECYDEALKDVFLYDIIDYLKIKYRGYKILYVPSCKAKLEERGFNHLKLIFEKLKLEEVNGLSQIDELNQAGKTLKERERMRHNYIYNGGYIQKLLIVDDVYTTGNSILGVYETMKQKAKIIDIIVLSRVEKK